MTDAAAEPVMVPNPYLAALRSHRSSAVSPAAELASALDDARTAIDGGAWFSTTADQFFDELTTQCTRLGQVQERSIEEFDDAIAGQPERVEQGAWQTHWSKLMGP